MRSVLIVSFYFFPENTPRAFRTTELVREFASRGDKVYVLLPKKACYSKATLLKMPGVDYLNSIPMDDEVQDVSMTPRSSRRGSRKHSILRRVLNYFFPRDPWRLFDWSMFKILLHFKEPIDICLSISQPLSVHLCFCFASIFNRRLRKSVTFADMSDPPYQGNYLTKVFPLYALWGYVVSPFFTYFLVPFSGAVSFYRKYKRTDYIKVIPQGFRLDDYHFSWKRMSTPHVPVFAYAGTFYRSLRDPEYFFSYLKKIEWEDFVFKLYVHVNDAYFHQMLSELSAALPTKVQLCQPLERMSLLAELANVDFVIDIGNESDLMRPSKLIDYALIKVPVYSFNKQTFDSKIFHDFLHGDYSRQTVIDIQEYNIVNVVDSILKLANKSI